MKPENGSVAIVEPPFWFTAVPVPDGTTQVFVAGA
jgi:hypothetical protein